MLVPIYGWLSTHSCWLSIKSRAVEYNFDYIVRPRDHIPHWFLGRCIDEHVILAAVCSIVTKWNEVNLLSHKLPQTFTWITAIFFTTLYQIKLTWSNNLFRPYGMRLPLQCIYYNQLIPHQYYSTTRGPPHNSPLLASLQNTIWLRFTIFSIIYITKHSISDSRSGYYWS